MKETTISKTKPNEWVRLVNTKTAPYWIHKHYNSDSKTYCLTKFDDTSHEIFVKANRRCWIGFTF